MGMATMMLQSRMMMQQMTWQMHWQSRLRSTDIPRMVRQVLSQCCSVSDAVNAIGADSLEAVMRH